MANPFLPGATKLFRRLVTPADFAVLNGQLIHELLSTFALGRDMEWTSRQFVEEMLEPGEAGIGTGLEIEHRGPAFAGETVEFTATFEVLRGPELTCTLRAAVGSRLVATGRTRQRIVPVGRLPRPPAATSSAA
ncbi:thioesterase family protein [uncultured Hymenobacter sp.]|uniref:thioesterase family protein n=1 Tax=uncultured Hymenobacter sp. TaxID=170016 RepID=UPI0035CBD5F2